MAKIFVFSYSTIAAIHFWSSNFPSTTGKINKINKRIAIICNLKVKTIFPNFVEKYGKMVSFCSWLAELIKTEKQNQLENEIALYMNIH